MTPSSLNIIRFALLGGSLFIGGVAWFLVNSGQMTPSLDEEIASIFRMIYYPSVAIVIVAIWMIRQRAGKAESFAQRGKLLLIGYALAEWLTLFGAIYLLLAGNASLFLGGLLLFMVAFAILPINQDPLE